MIDVKFISPSFKIDMLGQTGKDKLKKLEYIGRTCYNSVDKITDDSYEKFIKMLINKNHLSVLEFASFSVEFIVSRSTSHQMVRHRVASFMQQSQRYVTYNDEMNFILPSWMSGDYGYFYDVDIDGITLSVRNKNEEAFYRSSIQAAYTYESLIDGGWRPEQAREVLPNATATLINIHTNLREWRHIFQLRCHPSADPKIREIMLPLLSDIKKYIPIVFDDI